MNAGIFFLEWEFLPGWREDILETFRCIPTGNGDGYAGKSSPGLDFRLLVWTPWR